MLVLTRKRGQQCVIDERITIEVLEIRGSRVRIGISAPVDVRIRRQEVDQRDPSADVAVFSLATPVSET